MDYALIMAGGKGTRFWPLSRSKKPKQLLSMITEKTLLEEAVERIKPLISLNRVFVVTNKEQLPGIKKALPKLPQKNILAEPIGRNTAACIGWGIQEIAKQDPKAGVVVLPADHHIPETELFVATLKKALSVARSLEAPVTLGIRPTFPSTGYGYLKRGAAIKGVPGAYRLQSFHEKPDFKKARDYVGHGYLWNSGIFIWTVPVIQKAIEEHLPKHASLLEKIKREPKSLESVYPNFHSISVDYGIMEKVKKAYVVESTFRWNDIGSWESLRDFWPEDSSQNASRRDVVVINSYGNLVEAGPKKIIALLGVKNLAIIDTPDALLIANKNQLQDVRKIVELLEQKGKKEVL